MLLKQELSSSFFQYAMSLNIDMHTVLLAKVSGCIPFNKHSISFLRSVVIVPRNMRLAKCTTRPERSSFAAQNLFRSKTQQACLAHCQMDCCCFDKRTEPSLRTHELSFFSNFLQFHLMTTVLMTDFQSCQALVVCVTGCCDSHDAFIRICIASTKT